MPLLGGYDATKLRPQLKMAVARFKLASNKKSALIGQSSRDVAKLLMERPPQEERARIVVESMIRDENTIQAYETLGLSCDLLYERINMISSRSNSKRGCPIDLIECISTLIWSSTVLDSIPELIEIRKQFRYRYGREFESDAIRNAGGVVNPKVCSRLSVLPPSEDDVLSYMEKIALKHDIEWRRPPVDVEVDPPLPGPIPSPVPPGPIYYHGSASPAWTIPPNDIDEEDIYVPGPGGVNAAVAATVDVGAGGIAGREVIPVPATIGQGGYDGRQVSDLTSSYGTNDPGYNELVAKFASLQR
jgi:vacuolar protein sorting-associated protein IST1